MKASGRTRWRKPAAGHSHPRGSSNHNSSTPLRSTGIRVADPMPWGTHICLFYETKHDLLDTNAAYIKAGLFGSTDRRRIYCDQKSAGPGPR